MIKSKFLSSLSKRLIIDITLKVFEFVFFSSQKYFTIPFHVIKLYDKMCI